MKILSKTRDYYDNAAGYDSDDSVLFVRTQEEKDIIRDKDLYNLLFKTESRYPFNPSRFHYLRITILFFCGKVYPVYRYPISSDTFNVALEDRYKITFSADEVLEKMVSPKDRSDYQTDSIRFRNQHKFYKSLEQREIPLEYFQKYKTPYFSVRYRDTNSVRTENWDYITINPNLNDLEFFQVFHPMECRQEIEMYLANVLTQPDIAPQRVGSDEIIAKQKGFDDQSFRTLAPGKKKLNRKKNKELKRTRS